MTTSTTEATAIVADLHSSSGRAPRRNGLVFLGKRLISYIVIAFLSIVANFMLPRLLPGDPAYDQIQQIIAKTGAPPGPEEMESIYARYGNPDENIVVSFMRYLGETVQGDFGLSASQYPIPVVDLISRALPWTFYLGLASTVIGWIIGTYIGAYLGWKPGRRIDSIITPLAMFASGIPAFWLGIIAVWFFSLKMGWLPNSGAYNTELSVDLTNPTFYVSVAIYTILPLSVLVFTGFVQWMFTMRNMMITTVNEDYVHLARAKGLRPGVVRNKYAARNALLPNFTGLAQSIGGTLTTIALAEAVFIWPGVGGLLQAAQTTRDYPLMQALMLMVIFLSLAFNFLADSVYTLLDPRIKER